MTLIDDLATEFKSMGSQQLLQRILAQLEIQNKAKGKTFEYLTDVLVLDKTKTDPGNPQLVAEVDMPPYGVPYLDTVSLAWDTNSYTYFKWNVSVDSITQGNSNFKSFPNFTQSISEFENKNIPLLTGSKVKFFAYCNGAGGAVNGSAMLYVLANVV